MIETSFVGTPDGVVIRHIGVSTESAWRLNNDGSWARCLDHKGPWLSVPAVEVPISVMHALQDLRVGLGSGQKQEMDGEV